MHAPSRPHYAWFVCLGGALAMFVSIGLGANIFPYCLPDILATEGFSNTQGALLSTARTLSTSLSLLGVTWLLDRFSPRAVCAVGCLTVSTAFLLCCLSRVFWQYCASYVLMGMGYCLCGSVTVSLIVSRWFESRRSLALGIAMASVGLPPLLLPPVLSVLRSRGGLDAEFLFLSVLSLVLGVLSVLLLRSSPNNVGMTPYGAAAEQEKQTDRLDAPTLSRGQSLAVLLAALLFGAPGSSAFNFISVYLQGEGYDPAVASALMSFLGLVLTLGKLPCGQIYDKLGSRSGHVYVLSLLIVSQVLFLLLPTGSIPLAFLCLLLFGLGLPIGTVSIFRWSGDLYPPEKYASAVRWGTLAFTAGSMLFSPLGGAIADRYGSYQPAYLVYLLLALTGAALLLGIYARTGAGRRS